MEPANLPAGRQVKFAVPGKDTVELILQYPIKKGTETLARLWRVQSQVPDLITAIFFPQLLYRI